MKIRQNLDLNTCKNITTDCTAYKWWSTESTRSKHYFAINNLSALSIVSFLLTQNHFTDGNFLHLASFSIKLQGDTYFHDMTLIYFSRYLYIPSESYVKCQIKSKIIALPYKDTWDIENKCDSPRASIAHAPPPLGIFRDLVFLKGYWVPKSTQVVRPLDPVAFLAQGQKKICEI